ncbi:MAG: ABC transporter substrate-binding protein [Propionibacteriaceae bacterium]|jgi:oligopeptide transport system substrate-binding protein|nr:ABC transporter substrate-binding protein [Propionibacteriaceae bacterium]
MSLKKKGVALAAASLAMALSLGACAKSETPTTEGSTAAGDTSSSAPVTTAVGGVVYMNGTEPQNPLIPTSTNEVGGGRILTNLFAGLVYYDETGVTKMDMAESITSEDNLTWTVKLKADQVFSNGDPVDADAFINTWNWAADPANAQLNASWFAIFEGYQEVQDGTATTMSGLVKVDDLTFTMTLTAADPNAVLQLGYSAFYPVPKSGLADMTAFGQNPIGNGPYKLASDTAWQHDVQIELVPSETYKGDRQPHNAGVTYKFYQNTDNAYNDLLAGNLDVLDQIPNAFLENYESDLGAGAVNEPGSTFQSFTIPSRLAHFSGEEGTLRRQALSYAINRQEICDTIFAGSRTPAKEFSSPLMPGWDGNIPGNEVLTYDPEKAKELWAEADAISPWEGTFKIAYNADGPHQAWVDAVTNSIKTVLGIDAEGDPYPTFQASRTAITDRTIQTAFRTGWQADYPSIYNYLYTLYGSEAADGNGSNDGDYKNPEFDAALAAGLTKSDMADAAVEFNKAQEIILRDLPAIPLWYQNISAGYGSAVSNVIFGWDTVPIAYLIEKA